MIDAVDYNQRQHESYQAGRELLAASRARWGQAFAARAPAQRPLACLDLGSGTGRFTALLAELFGGPVYGVEPFDRMREQAEASPHPEAVRYLAGRAEAIPLPDASCDLVLMFLSFHHVRDRPAAAREIRRVLRPGGRLLIRSHFSDRMPEVHWHRWFPSARAVELKMFPALADVTDLFAEVGLEPVALDVIRETFTDTLAESARRLRTRAISTFEHLDEAEIEDGFRRMEAEIAEGPEGPTYGDCDLLILG
ncbi:class I SAM-dependent methyltransferase [Brevundimonas sp.]|uniref:class I SAM-dependent methyltransferase n=1 Tax=Brevundimonas sp. TaxID=1871086 RepID=UPI002D37C722|nr:class I SAM-dependent methyltransferase [Brevundimonas sp.]HYC67448.1 class I SAM-dependent methyltransferase [Brevundimonas sp.]